MRAELGHPRVGPDACGSELRFVGGVTDELVRTLVCRSAVVDVDTGAGPRILHDFRVYSGGEQDRGGAVTQAVESDWRVGRPERGVLGSSPTPAWVQCSGPPRDVGEDESGGGPVRSAHGGDLYHHARGGVDAATGDKGW